MAEASGITYVYHSGVRAPLNLHPTHPVLMRCISASPPGPSTDPRRALRPQESSSFCSDLPSPSPIAPYTKPQEEEHPIQNAITKTMTTDATKAMTATAASTAPPTASEHLEIKKAQRLDGSEQVEERPSSSQIRSMSSGRNGISQSADQVEVGTETGAAPLYREEEREEEQPHRASSSIRILRVTHHNYVDNKTPTKDDQLAWAHKEKEQGGSVASLAPGPGELHPLPAFQGPASQRQLFSEPDSFSTSYSSPLQSAMVVEQPQPLCLPPEGPKEQTGGEQKKLLARKWMNASSGAPPKADTAAIATADTVHASCTPILDKYDGTNLSVGTHATASLELPACDTNSERVLSAEEEATPAEKRTPVMTPMQSITAYDDAIARFTGFPSPVKLSPIPTKAYATCVSTPKSASSEDKILPNTTRQYIEETRLPTNASCPESLLKGTETSSVLPEGSFQTAAPLPHSSTLVFSQTHNGTASMNVTAPYPNETTANQTRSQHVASTDTKSHLSVSAVSSPNDTVVIRPEEQSSEVEVSAPPTTGTTGLDSFLQDNVYSIIRKKTENPQAPPVNVWSNNRTASSTDAFEREQVEDHRTLKDQTLPPSAAGLDTSFVNTPALSSIHTPHFDTISPAMEGSIAQGKRGSSDGSVQSFEIQIKGIPPPHKTPSIYEVNHCLARAGSFRYNVAEKTKRILVSPPLSEGRSSSSFSQDAPLLRKEPALQQSIRDAHQHTIALVPPSCGPEPAAAAAAVTVPNTSLSSLIVDEVQKVHQPEPQQQTSQKKVPCPPLASVGGMETRKSSGSSSLWRRLDRQLHVEARQQQQVVQQVSRRASSVQQGQPGTSATSVNMDKKEWYATWVQNLSTKAVDSWM